MAVAGGDDDVVKGMDEAMMDYNDLKGESSYNPTDSAAGGFSDPVDFNDSKHERRNDRTDRRATSFSDRRRKDRRRTSRDSDSGKPDKAKTSVDPMQIYLREMGTLTLLNHGEELKLA